MRMFKWLKTLGYDNIEAYENFGVAVDFNERSKHSVTNLSLLCSSLAHVDNTRPASFKYRRRAMETLFYDRQV